MDNKILIAYFMQKNHDLDSASKKVAEKVGNALAAKNYAYETFAITPTEEYPADEENFEMATKAEKAARHRPELTSKFSDMKDVKYIVLVAPNWWNDLPMAVYSFFDGYDFAHKKIVPVILHGGDGADAIAASMRKYLHEDWVLPAVAIANTEADTADVDKIIAELFQPSTHEY